MKLALVTPTSDRPEAFALCERWMRAQTVPWKQWIVADDGLEAAECTMNQLHLRLPRVADGYASQKRNLLSAIDNLDDDIEAIAVIEDDDHYAPKYLEIVVQKLNEGYSLVGQNNGYYYNVRCRKWVQWHTDQWSSLSMTSFKKTEEHMAALRDILVRNPNPLVDIQFWRTRSPNTRAPIDESLVVGMKALPGRAGLASGHNDLSAHKSWGRYQEDPDLKKLTELIGTDAQAYAGFYDPNWVPK